MDLTSMVWFIRICLAVQRHNTSGLGGYMRADTSNQRAKNIVRCIIEKIASPNAKVDMLTYVFFTS